MKNRLEYEEELLKKKMEYSVLMKLIIHYSNSILVVITYKMPQIISISFSNVSAKPDQSFYNLECVFGMYTNSSFYLITLLKILVPYLFGISILILWIGFMRRKVKDLASSKLIGLFVVLFFNT